MHVHDAYAILTSTKVNADRFIQDVDSAAVYVNASTRFTEGANSASEPTSPSAPKNSTLGDQWGWQNSPHVNASGES